MQVRWCFVAPNEIPDGAEVYDDPLIVHCWRRQFEKMLNTAELPLEEFVWKFFEETMTLGCTVDVFAHAEDLEPQAKSEQQRLLDSVLDFGPTPDRTVLVRVVEHSVLKVAKGLH